MSRNDRQAKMERIRILPQQVTEAVKGLNEEQLNTPYGEGKWTLLQLVHHLADAHINAFVRMKLLLTEENPTLKPYDQDKWARTGEANKYPVEASLNILRGLHERWYGLLGSLAEDNWRRRGFHPEVGEITVDDLLDTYAKHGDAHVQRILEMRQSKGW